ncbi:MAG: phosphoribosylglycinamide formyltransferase, partial [Azonexus sp.]
MKNIVILISGRGSNMEALIAARDAGTLPVNIAAVISNRPAAAGLETAEKAGITAHYIDHKAFAERDAFDAALAECIDSFAPDLVVLAGFMRILSDAFVRHYAGRLMNIHPSLLPAFPGLHTHR